MQIQGATAVMPTVPISFGTGGCFSGYIWYVTEFRCQAPGVLYLLLVWVMKYEISYGSFYLLSGIGECLNIISAMFKHLLSSEASPQ